MDSRSKAVIAAAFLGAVGTIIGAYISRSPDTSPSITETSPSVTCDQIPPVQELTPQPRKGWVWVPTDFKLSSGKLEAVEGHWKPRTADGKNKYLPGHWETGTGRCVWVPGKFV